MKTSEKRRTLHRQPTPERIVNNAPRTFTEADFPVGTIAHQGDLILVRIAAIPLSAKSRTNRQLAIGDTQGARHVLSVGLPYDCNPADVASAIHSACNTIVDLRYIGPVFETVESKASIIHPEHGHHHYEGDMAIACVYQRNLDAEEREQRTQD